MTAKFTMLELIVVTIAVGVFLKLALQDIPNIFIAGLTLLFGFIFMRMVL